MSGSFASGYRYSPYVVSNGHGLVPFFLLNKAEHLCCGYAASPTFTKTGNYMKPLPTANLRGTGLALLFTAFFACLSGAAVAGDQMLPKVEVTGLGARSAAWFSYTTDFNIAHNLETGSIGRTESGDDDAKTKDCKNSASIGANGDGTSGNPVVLLTGNKIESEVDFRSAGEMGLFLARTYDKMWTGIGLFGRQWLSNFDYKLTFGTSKLNACYPKPGGGACAVGSNTIIWSLRPDGRRIRYLKNAIDGIFYEDKPSPISKIVVQQNGNFLLNDEDNNIETYSSSGYVLSVLDSHRVGWTFSYNATYPTRVTHTSGRYIDFVWNSGLLTSVRDPAGNYYGYSYAANKLGAGQHLLLATSRPGTPTATIAYYYEDPNYPEALTGKSFGGVRYSWITYNGNGQAASTEHGGGNDRYTFVRDINANHEFYVRETNPLGKQTDYVYANSQPKSVTAYGSAHCVGTYREYTYDPNGYDDVVTDFNGDLTDYDYNAKGQLLKKVEAVGTPVERTWLYSWDVNANRVLSETLVGVRRTNYSYDADSRLASIVVTNLSANGVPNQASQSTYSYTKQPNGMLASVTIDGPIPGANDALILRYDADGDLISQEDGLGHKVSWSGHNGLGLPGRRVGVNGDINDYTYDGEGRVTRIRTYPNGSAADHSFVYNDQDLLVSETTEDGISTFYEYDSSRRLVDQYRAANGTAGAETSREKEIYYYDLMGNLIKVEDQKLAGHYETQCFQTRMVEGMPECVDERQVWVGTPTTSKTILVDYDELGRVIARRGNNSQNFRYGYDDNGEVATITDSIGHVATLGYDALGRPNVLTDAKVGVTRIEYDDAGNATKLTDPRGLVTSYVYDGFGRLWSQTSPDSGLTRYQYDAAGQQVGMTRASGDSISYNYDGTGRLTSIVGGGQTQIFTYDSCANGLGLLCQISDGTGTVTFAYTPEGFRASQSSEMPAGGKATVGYAYDNLGRLSGITYPNGVGVGYGYANGKLTAITATINGITTNVASYINYQPYGGASSWTYGNNLVRGNNYDMDGRLTGISVSAGSSVLQSLTYAYNANDLITKITNGVNAGATQSYSYDELSRLSSFSTGYGDTLSYLFDANGNRQREDWLKNGVTTPTTYDIAAGSNQLTAMSGRFTRSYTYDADGNPTTIGGLGQGLTYDPFNRLTSVTTSAGTTSYSVNALGQRIYKYAPGVGQYWFVYGAGGELIADYKSGGQYWTNYIWFGGQIIGFVRNQQLYYVSSDHLGRPELVTNSSGAAVWRAVNYAFNRSLSLNSLGEFNVGFPGQYFDAETGHWYNGYRDFDDDAGRYLESDPLGLSAGVNTYAYVKGNPVMAVDSLGLKTCLLTTVATGGVRDHAAVYTSRGDGAGGPALYDPAGSYGAANGGGSSGLVTGNAANIGKFTAFHKGQQVESTCKDTSQKEEQKIIDKASNLPSAAPFECAIMSSTALSGQPSFPYVQAGTFFPGNLLRQFRRGP